MYGFLFGSHEHTLDQAVVDLRKSEFSLSLAYVAFSRVKPIEGLLI